MPGEGVELKGGVTAASATLTPDNRYFVVPPNSSLPLHWNPTDSNDRPTYDCRYFGGVLSEFERRRRGSGLTVYLTADVERLPSYGQDVVAIVISDELARYPAYLDCVRATFKCYGTDLIEGPGVVANPDLLGFATSVQYARTNARRLPNVIRHRLRRLTRHVSRRPIHAIPLGYLRQANLPLVPINERQYDAYFRGSMAQRESLSLTARLLQSPKTISRTDMIAQLRRIASRHPELSIVVEGIPAFFTGSDDEALAFSQAMMQTKVCIVPRGASFETFRYFEAMRYGCVVIAEPLPKRWFYDGSPAITLERWSDLEGVMLPLLRDRGTLQRYHRASLEWWNRVCGESAVGAYMDAVL